MKKLFSRSHKSANQRKRGKKQNKRKNKKGLGTLLTKRPNFSDETIQNSKSENLKNQKHKNLKKETKFDRKKQKHKKISFEEKTEAYKKRLESSKFRILNEFLYTNNAEKAQKYFKESPKEFEIVEIFCFI